MNKKKSLLWRWRLNCTTLHSVWEPSRFSPWIFLNPHVTLNWLTLVTVKPLLSTVMCTCTNCTMYEMYINQTCCINFIRLGSFGSLWFWVFFFFNSKKLLKITNFSWFPSFQIIIPRTRNSVSSDRQRHSKESRDKLISVTARRVLWVSPDAFIQSWSMSLLVFTFFFLFF